VIQIPVYVHNIPKERKDDEIYGILNKQRRDDATSQRFKIIW
jgi:hypothetical protein